MASELDEVLLDQIYVARRNRKLLGRYEEILPNDAALEAGKSVLDARIAFLEGMVEDKSLLTQRLRRKKPQADDILKCNPVFEWWRTTMYVTVFGSQMLYRSMVRYMFGLRQNKKAETDD